MKNHLTKKILTTYNNLECLYEDNHFIAINKRSGDISQKDKEENISLIEIIKQYLKIKYKKKNEVFLGSIHRLDRPVSGAILFAKTSKALSRANKMIQKREFKKTYFAITENKPEKKKDRLIHYLIKNTKQNKSYASLNLKKGAKEAILEYRILDSFTNYHLLKINLFSGRHHQIRTQLSFIGSPIKGDLKYGAHRANPNLGIDLHARSIEFIHPISKKEIYIQAPFPKGPLWKDYENNKKLNL